MCEVLLRWATLELERKIRIKGDAKRHSLHVDTTFTLFAKFLAQWEICGFASCISRSLVAVAGCFSTGYLFLDVDKARYHNANTAQSKPLGLFYSVFLICRSGLREHSTGLECI